MRRRVPSPATSTVPARASASRRQVGDPVAPVVRAWHAAASLLSALSLTLDPSTLLRHSVALIVYVLGSLDNLVLSGLAREMWWSRPPAGAQGKGKGKELRRRRAERAQAAEGGGKYFPGMVNLSGTLCYMNSVLQACASVPAFVTHLDRIIALAVEVDVPTLVADALLDVLNDLNTPHPRLPRALRPVELLHALHTVPAVVRLLSTREQQDAHELFVVLSEAVANEAVAVAAEAARARGLGDVLALQGYVVRRDTEPGAVRRQRARGVAQPWEGLLARRRVCQRCGWYESVRVETLGGMELSLPLSGDVTLDACIAAYLAPEALSDVTCEMCSLRQTVAHYAAEAERLSAPPTPSATTPPTPGSTSFDALRPQPDAGSSLTASRKKRAQAARKVHARLEGMLAGGTVSHFGEAVLPPLGPGQGGLAVKWQNVRTASTREALVSRPPHVLRLHLVRSEYTPYGQLLKKTARVACPLVLDLSPYVSHGVWEDRVSYSVRGLLARPQHVAKRRALYRLEAAILHYGYTHSSGHYICLRRKPRPPAQAVPAVDGEAAGTAEGTHGGSGAYRPRRGHKSCPDDCTCQNCAYFGQVREAATPGKGWLRVSDADVDEVGEEELVANRGHVFMLFYELVDEASEWAAGAQEETRRRVDGSGEADAQAVQDEATVD
ncbi:ubiquitin-specific protease ubp1 [Cryptotrichosporon argae]